MATIKEPARLALTLHVCGTCESGLVMARDTRNGRLYVVCPGCQMARLLRAKSGLVELDGYPRPAGMPFSKTLRMSYHAASPA